MATPTPTQPGAVAFVNDALYFHQQQEAYTQLGVNMPPPLPWSPYLKCKITGVIYPWTDGMGDYMGDKVENAFNLQGSTNETDLAPEWREKRAASLATRPIPVVMDPKNGVAIPAIQPGVVVPTLAELQAQYNASGNQQVNAPTTPSVVEAVRTTTPVLPSQLSDPTPAPAQAAPVPLAEAKVDSFTSSAAIKAAEAEAKQMVLMSESETIKDATSALAAALGDDFLL